MNMTSGLIITVISTLVLYLWEKDADSNIMVGLLYCGFNYKYKIKSFIV